MGRYLPLFSTISRIPTTLNYFPLFPVSEGAAVQNMPNNGPMRVNCPWGSYPINRGDYPWGLLSHRGNGPRGVVIQVVSNWRG